jgi:hypothetical protein
MSNTSIGFQRTRFTDAELRTLQGHEGEGSGAVLARVAKDAGYVSVVARGDDATHAELAARFHGALPSVAEAADTAAHGAEIAFEIGELGGAAVEGFGVLAPPLALAAGLASILEANAHGEALARAFATDEVHVAMLTHLSLPDGFRQEQLARYPDAGKGFASGAQKMTTALAGRDHAMMALVQLQCDRGMHAALGLVGAGTSQAAFLGAHPEHARRYAEDPAFRAGFDAIVWAKDQPAALRGAISELAARDARYDAAHVAVRG